MPKGNEVGERIAQARRELGVRERRDVRPVDVARAVGVSGATVSDWEAGKIVPRDDAMERLAAFLGVSPAFLRYGVREGQMVEPNPALDRRVTASERAAAEGLTAAQPRRKKPGDGDPHRRRGAGGA